MMHENTTYTRTYPQTSQSNQYSYSPVIRPRSVPDQAQYHPVSQQPIRITRLLPSHQPRFAPPIRYHSPHHGVSNSNYSSISASAKSEKLSHFDYVETDINSQYSSSCDQTSYQNRLENQGNNSTQINQSTFKLNHIPSYSLATQHAIIGQFTPNIVNSTSTNRAPTNQQSNIISNRVISAAQSQFQVQQQPNIITQQQKQTLRHVIPSPQLVRTNMGQSPGARLQTITHPQLENQTQLIHLQTAAAQQQQQQPTILNQQSGHIIRTEQGVQQLQGTPVMLQVNGGQRIRGQIASLNNPNTSQPTHVYFTIPQGSQIGGQSAKFIKTPNGHLRPVNGVALQSSLSQSKMYTVRYAVAPRAEEGKQKQQYTIYTPVSTPPNNTVNISNVNGGVPRPNEKVILPKPNITSPVSVDSRKRKYIIYKPNTPNKFSKVEPVPKPSVSAVPILSPESQKHNELVQRVSKSLEADKEVVQRPNTAKPFESFTDAFRRLMKYHIYYEPDCKEVYLKKVDKTHEQISQKLLARKQDIQNNLHSQLLEDAARSLPNVTYSLDYITLLSESITDEQEEIEKLKIELAKAKLDAKLRAELGESSKNNDSADDSSTCILGTDLDDNG